MILSNNIRHYINGQDFGEPIGWDGLKININWLNNKEGLNINITDLEFAHKANAYLQKRILNGLDGGVGVFEGEPYEIRIGSPEAPVYTFKGYLDFTDENTIIGKERIKLSLKKQKGEDWLNDVAFGYSLAYLDSIGAIKEKDKIKVPYVINHVPDGMQLIVLSMSIYMMTKELIENVQKLAETIADVTNASTPVIGVSVGLGAGVVTAWDLGDFIMVTLKALARIAYIVALVVAIKELVNQIFEQILPVKRYHLGMSVKGMFETYCNFLGLKLKSSLLDEYKNLVHIPQKSVKGGEKKEKCFPESNSVIGTFGDLITVFKMVFKADFRIIDGVFIFEREDYFKNIGNYVLPDVITNQSERLNVFSLNTEEIVSNYNIYFDIDTQDGNTLEGDDGRVFQAVTRPIKKINEDFVTIKNLAEVSIPFSLGKTKNGLTDVEKMAKTLGKAVDKITGVFGKGTNYANKIENRIGALLLTSHYTSVGKLVVLSGVNLEPNQRQFLSASLLWDKYHYISSFAEINGLHNQFYRFKGVLVPMTLKEFEELINNNYAKDSQGGEIMIESIEYDPTQRTALIDYRLRKKYTNNLKIDYVK